MTKQHRSSHGCLQVQAAYGIVTALDAHVTCEQLRLAQASGDAENATR